MRGSGSSLRYDFSAPKTKLNQLKDNFNWLEFNASKIKQALQFRTYQPQREGPSRTPPVGKWNNPALPLASLA